MNRTILRPTKIAIGLLVFVSAAFPSTASAQDDEAELRKRIQELDAAVASWPEPTAERLGSAKKLKESTDPKARAAAIAEITKFRPRRDYEELVFRALNDPAPEVRFAAMDAASIVLNSCGTRGPEMFLKLQAMRDSDPSLEVKVTAQTIVVQGASADSGARLVMLLTRVRMMARSDSETDRATAATLLAAISDNQQTRVGNGFREQINDLDRLLSDPAASVRRAAGVALVQFVRADELDMPAAKIVLRELSNPPQLDRDSFAAMLATVPWFASAGVGDFSRHSNAQIRVAALLGIEQPMKPPINGPPADPKHRVPIPIAIGATRSPSERVRRLAMYSLLWPDPADSTRNLIGTAAVLAASADPDPAIVVEAVDALVDRLCGGQGPDSWVHRENGARFVWNGGARPRALSTLLDQAFSGPTDSRVKAIQLIGAGRADDLLLVWPEFAKLMTNTDLQVQAAALAAARQMIRQVVSERSPASLKTSVPAPAIAPIP